MKNNDVVPWVLNSILSKYITSQNPHVRQAACIWLLSLVKKLSQHKEIMVGLLYIDIPLNSKDKWVSVQRMNTDITSRVTVFASLVWLLKSRVVLSFVISNTGTLP